MGWPQIVMIVWLTIMGIVSFLRDGETIKYSFVGFLVILVLYMVIFHYSGFWNGKGC